MTIWDNILTFKDYKFIKRTQRNRNDFNELKALAHSVGIFFWMMDREKNVYFLDNKVSAEMILLSFTPESRARVRKVLLEDEQRESTEVDVEIDPRFDLTFKYLRFYIFRINDPDSKFVSYGKIVAIDQFKRQEKELKEAYKIEEQVALKESFLASMGHEIRTPLNAIVGFLQLLVTQKDTATKEELQEYSSIIKDNTEQLLELLERSVDVGTGQGSINPPLSEKVVGDIMEDLYNTHLVIIPQNLRFIMKRGPELKVMTNRSYFLQIVSNLLSNAVKFTKQGSITMGWEKRGDKAVVFVQDTGCGIPQDKMEDIFRAYYKTDSTTAGAGIGLELCRHLAESMGSEIKASSSPGKGSRFELIIDCITI